MCMSVSVNSGAFYRFPETCGQFGFIAYEMWGFVSSLKPEWVCVGFLYCVVFLNQLMSFLELCGALPSEYGLNSLKMFKEHPQPRFKNKKSCNNYDLTQQ